uniref:Uncharacterized protein n=1 Tax=Globodera rostochiensis TaxID=31243 RepID=A0A914HGR4_GLORO
MRSVKSVRRPNKAISRSRNNQLQRKNNARKRGLDRAKGQRASQIVTLVKAEPNKKRGDTHAKDDTKILNPPRSSGGKEKVVAETPETVQEKKTIKSGIVNNGASDDKNTGKSERKEETEETKSKAKKEVENEKYGDDEKREKEEEKKGKRKKKTEERRKEEGEKVVIKKVEEAESIGTTVSTENSPQRQRMVVELSIDQKATAARKNSEAEAVKTTKVLGNIVEKSANFATWHADEKSGYKAEENDLQWELIGNTRGQRTNEEQQIQVEEARGGEKGWNIFQAEGEAEFVVKKRKTIILSQKEKMVKAEQKKRVERDNGKGSREDGEDNEWEQNGGRAARIGGGQHEQQRRVTKQQENGTRCVDEKKTHIAENNAARAVAPIKVEQLRLERITRVVELKQLLRAYDQGTWERLWGDESRPEERNV